MADPNYGQDLSLLTEFGGLFTMTSGAGLVLQAVYRRWTTPRDSVAGARIYQGQCRDIRGLLGSRFDAITLATWEHDLAETAKQDERVDACTVSLTQTGGKVLTLRAKVTVSGVTSLLVIPFDSFTPEVILAQL